MDVIEITGNVFYVFGCWAIVSISFAAGYFSTKDSDIPETKFKTLIFGIYKTIACFFGIILLVGISMVSDYYREKFGTLEGFVQAFIVITTPAAFGVQLAIERKRKASSEKDKA